MYNVHAIAPVTRLLSTAFRTLPAASESGEEVCIYSDAFIWALKRLGKGIACEADLSFYRPCSSGGAYCE